MGVQIFKIFIKILIFLTKKIKKALIFCFYVAIIKYRGRSFPLAIKEIGN